MIILDIETTGTDPRVHSIVSIGALEFENPDNRFYAECRIFDGAHIEDKALEIIGLEKEDITDPSKKTDKQIVEDFFAWILEVPERTIGGHNTHFDIGFISETARRYHLENPIAHRVVDLHSLAYMHMIQKGIVPPVDPAHHHTALSSQVAEEYTGIPAEPHPHVAINGATWEAEAISRILYGKNLLEEFKKYPIQFGIKENK